MLSQSATPASTPATGKPFRVAISKLGKTRYKMRDYVIVLDARYPSKKHLKKHIAYEAQLDGGKWYPVVTVNDREVYAKHIKPQATREKALKAASGLADSMAKLYARYTVKVTGPKLEVKSMQSARTATPAARLAKVLQQWADDNGIDLEKVLVADHGVSNDKIIRAVAKNKPLPNRACRKTPAQSAPKPARQSARSAAPKPAAKSSKKPAAKSSKKPTGKSMKKPAPVLKFPARKTALKKAA